jgi:DNA anti-recombination protein RmuC
MLQSGGNQDGMATSKNTAQTAVDKYFEALTESYDAMIEAIKLGNERGYRISTNMLTEAQRGQREAVELGRKLADDPTDVGGFYRALMESTTKAQGRALELARQMFDELSESRTETRDTIEKVVKAQRSAGEAAVEAARDVASTTADRVRTGVSRVTNRVGAEAGEVADATKEGAERTRKTAASAANGAGSD